MYFLMFSQKNQKISWLFCYITLAFCMLLNWIQLQPESKRTDVIRRKERKSYWSHRCINSIHVQILWLSLRIRANLKRTWTFSSAWYSSDGPFLCMNTRQLHTTTSTIKLSLYYIHYNYTVQLYKRQVFLSAHYLLNWEKF